MGTTTSIDANWHALEIGVALSLSSSSLDGISTTAAQQRLRQYGPNRIRPQQRQGPLRRLLYQFKNVLIYVLLTSSLITALLAHWVDTAVILSVIIINAIIGFIQEGKAERALDAIRHMLSYQAIVKRDDQLVEVPAEQLVPGDIVLLQSGDKVPDDLRRAKT